MWFSRFFKNKDLDRYHSDNDYLSSIELEKLMEVYSSDLSMVQVNSICDSIVDYNQLLIKVISYFKEDHMLYPYQVPNAINNIFMRDFYLYKDSYIDIVFHTTEFIRLAREFLDIYELNERTKKTFNIEKNMYLTANMVSNIRTLSKEMCIT